MTQPSLSDDPESVVREGRPPVQWSLRMMFALMTVIALLCVACFQLNLPQILRTGGIIGLVVLSLGVVLLLVGFRLCFTARKRNTLILYGASALFPLALGLFGTWLGHQVIETLASGPQGASLDQEAIRVGYRTAWITTHLGIVFSVSIVVTAGIGLATYQTSCESGSRPLR